MSIESPSRGQGPRGIAPDMSQATEEQEKGFRLAVDDGKNLFLTGGGGTGKSWLTRKIKEGLIANGKKHDSVHICTPSWLSALQVDALATTHHKLFSMGISDESHYSDWKAILKFDKSTKIQRIETLIFDEISMVSASRLDYIDCLTRRVRKEMDKPFGGMQVLFVGDFYQLPPIQKLEPSKRSTTWCPNKMIEDGYAFEAKVWKEAQIRTVELTLSMRLSGGHENFQRILNEIRKGICSRAMELGDLTALNCPEGATKLFCVNEDVKNENDSELEKIKEPEEPSKVIVRAIKYEKRDDNSGGYTKIYEWDQIRNDDEFRGKKGAKVLCTVNLVIYSEKNGGSCKRLANGSRGTIVEYVGHEVWHAEMTTRLERFTNLVCGVRYINDPANGDVEVADIEQGKTKLEYLKEAVNWFAEKTHCIRVPKVHFEDLDEVVVMLPCDSFTDQASPNEETLQVPLKLAWAITVHKAQGMSLLDLHVNVSRSFAPGQVYTGLSRAIDPQRLYIEGDLNVLKGKIQAESKVKEFYEDPDPYKKSVSGKSPHAENIRGIVLNDHAIFPAEQRRPDNKCDKCNKHSRACLDWKTSNSNLLDKLKCGANTRSHNVYKFLIEKALPLLGYTTNDALRGVSEDTLYSEYKALINDNEKLRQEVTSIGEENTILKPRFRRIVNEVEELFANDGVGVTDGVTTTQESVASSGGGASQSSAGEGGSPTRPNAAGGAAGGGGGGGDSNKRWLVYHLECRENKHYVGMTEKSLEERFKEHAAGKGAGAEWTKKYSPFEKEVLKDGYDEEEDALSRENRETVRLMSVHGVDNVRGGKWANVELLFEQRAEIDKLIQERERKRKREE